MQNFHWFGGIILPQCPVSLWGQFSSWKDFTVHLC